LFPAAIAVSEHVAGGLATGVTWQVSERAETFSPPEGLIVIVDFADSPGATVPGDNALAARLKFGADTIRLNPVEVLALKFESPL
jgi:hypothetical protein